ncbi:MAG: metallophosphoesterase [Deltaproteobacteria bacterium]|nr:metallophosphoesterase [Deltaproteobacteria bacterium]
MARGSRRGAAILALAVVALMGCRCPPPIPAETPTKHVAVEARYPGGPRLVAIGDLHGDLERTREALRLAGAIDEKDQWIGGDLVVVQTGDQLDRGDGERAILDLFERLAREAQAAGGAVHALIGNHETMNVAGRFQYVTEAGFRAFAGLALKAAGVELFEERQRGRAAAFLPGGEYALKLGRRDTIAIVGESVFVHGGLHGEHLGYGIDRINREIRDWSSGRVPGVPKCVSENPSPLWTRIYGTPEVAPEVCRQLETVLGALGARRMVVGHTLQEHGISSACEGRVWRIDVGLSKVFGERPVQVLEIEGREVRVRSAPVAAEGG